MNCILYQYMLDKGPIESEKLSQNIYIFVDFIV